MGKDAPRLTRRELVTTSLGMMGTAALSGTIRGAARVPDFPGRLKQAVCRWPYASTGRGRGAHRVTGGRRMGGRADRILRPTARRPVTAAR